MHRKPFVRHTARPVATLDNKQIITNNWTLLSTSIHILHNHSVKSRNLYNMVTLQLTRVHKNKHNTG